MKLNSTRFALLTALGAIAVATLANCEAATNASIAELRAQAASVLAPLPDKMPGGEKDTPTLVELGKKLYFEKKMSVNGTQSCNDCHKVDQNFAGVDNEPTSPGAEGKRGDRNSPTTLNAGFHFAQFWDGRAKTLEEQAKGPVLNPVEMGMPSETEVIKRLSADASYPQLFKTAFPDEKEPMSYDTFARAVAAFERTLITRDRFDDFLKGNDKALTAQEIKGLDFFLNTGCTTCHTGPTIGGNMYQKIGIIHPYPNKKDLGRIKVTNEEWDELRFKVPSLRNVGLTWPYFHDGTVAELNEAVKQMAYMQLGKELTQDEVSALTAFLQALSDKERRATKDRR